MNKKGMAWGTIVTAIIALIVLVTLIWIFREQIGAISDKFFEIIKQTDSSTEEFSRSIKDLVQE